MKVIPVEMVVEVDQAWEDQILGAGLNRARVADQDTGRLFDALPDSHDLPATHEHASVSDDVVLAIHRHHSGASNQNPAKRRPGLDDIDCRTRTCGKQEHYCHSAHERP